LNYESGNFKHLKAETEERFDEKYWDLMTRCETIYNNMLASGVAPEQARMVLPQSMMTEWYWTGSLVAFARVVSQRISEDAQVW
jgi:thymidylate synthase (FAD)